MITELSEGGDYVPALEIYKAIYSSSGLGGIIARQFPKIKIDKDLSINLNSLLKEAYYQASKMEHLYVGTEHLLLALLKIAKHKDFKTVANHLQSSNIFPKAMKMLSDKKENVILNSFGSNLNRTAVKKSSKQVVRKAELDKLIAILLKKSNANPLIVGEYGVGKQSLVDSLVESINSLEVPTFLAGYQIYEFDLMAFASSILNKGGLELSLSALQEELKGLNRAIIYIKNFQNLFISTSSGMGVPLIYPMFKDLLQNSGINFIATLHSSLYEKLAVDNSFILDSFTVLDVNEPSEEETIQILTHEARMLETFHGVRISSEVIKYIYDSAKSLQMDTFFPQKGVDLLDASCAYVLVSENRVPKDYKDLVDQTVILYGKMDKAVSAGTYEQALKIQTKLDSLEKRLLKYEKSMISSQEVEVTNVAVDETLRSLNLKKKEHELLDKDKLSNLYEQVRKEIIGQDQAVESVVKALIRSGLGLRPGNRPIGNFFFLGPTGVGKTELAKVLAREAFEDDGKSHLIRLDMSDFSEKHTVARLVGAPPGYVGYSDGGELTSKIESQPDSVVLFDEIEKAHPDVLNILLQIMEEGELVDAKGNTFEFDKAVIILTSNLGTEILHGREIGFKDSGSTASDSDVEKNLKQNLKKILKPELINRFDEIVVFKRLSKDDQMKILNLLLTKVNEQVREQDVTLHVYRSAKKHLLELGYSQEYGARSLRRVVEKELLDRVAEILLATKKRPIKISIRAHKGKLTATSTFQRKSTRKN